jgi:hypothetical protein
MFKRILQAASAQGPVRASAGETPAMHAEPSNSPIGELPRTEFSPDSSATKLLNFDEVYRRSTFKTSSKTSEWHILKIADMLNSEHLRGLSPAAKHSALMMALEAGGVAVEDMLQDAVQRQRVLNDCEESHVRRLQEIESIKQRENERLNAEMESVCAKFRARITAGIEEIEREHKTLRDWQERKEREQRRIAEAAAACVSGDSATSSDASVTRLLEKNANASAARFGKSA